MKLEFFFTGKTTDKYIAEGVEIYLGRLKHYVPVSVTVIPAHDGGSKEAPKAESERMLAKLKPTDLLVLLDEKGKSFTSQAFARELEKWMVAGTGRVVMAVGGAYGFTDEIRKRANLILSASSFTFTHQMIRLILAEQVYRAFTIIRGEKYHHD